MKHAFLILAHDNFDLLKYLISLLDDDRCDIFIHIDKKKECPNLSTSKSNLFVFSEFDVRWGDFSIVQAELFLYEQALKATKERYNYFHLLSGVDLPIKPMDEFYNFLEKNYGNEFVSFESCESKRITDRVAKWHVLTKYYKSPFFIRNMVKILRFVPEHVMNFFVKRSDVGIVAKGSQWCSLTYDAVEYIMTKRDFINKRFINCCCPDEHFIQIILYNSMFRNKIINNNLREIDFNRSPNGASPYTWTTSEDDFKILSDSKGFFARKFSLSDFKKLKNMIEFLCKRGV